MVAGLQARGGKNASPKPFWFQNASYGTRTSYPLSQTGGPQLLVPGPAYPGSGSKNDPGRAQDTPGQADLGNERYMGARSRLVIFPTTNSFGMVYGVSGTLVGDIYLVRQDGKAILVGSIGPVASEPSPAVYTVPAPPEPPALGPFWCLAPGEDIIFVPNTGTAGSSAGEGYFIPAFVDVDLLCFRQLITTTKEAVLTVPPGKVWHAVPNFAIEASAGIPSAGHSLGLLNMNADPAEYELYLNRGEGADITIETGLVAAGARFSAFDLGGGGGEVLPTESFMLPAGHSLKVKLEDPLDDVYFAAIMAEYNQADESDESFANPTLITPNG